MFWTNFVNLCEKKSMSPNAVCAELGFSKATATHWKKGSKPNGEALIKLAEYFDTTIDYLMGLSQVKDKEPTIRLSNTEAEYLHILNCVKSDYDKAKLIGYSECYAKTLPSYKSLNNDRDGGTDAQQRLDKTS